MLSKNYSLTFKRVVMDSETTKGSGDTDRIVIGNILNKNQ